MPHTTRVAYLTTAWVLVCWSAGRAAADQLADALAAHRAAVESVDSVHFHFDSSRVRSANHGPPSEQIRGEYWRTCDRQRIDQTKKNGESISSLISADRIVSIGQFVDPKTGQPLRKATINANAGPINFEVVPWRDSLFALESKRGKGTAGLGEYLKSVPGLTTYKVENGQGLITTANGAVDIRLDPKRNYLIAGQTVRIGARKNVMRPSDPPQTLQFREAVREFQEVVPGIYFPKQVVIEELLGDELQATRTVTFTKVVINTPLAPGTFEPKYLNGTEVTDFIRSKKYSVNDAGVTQGAEGELKLIGVAPLSDVHPDVLEHTRPTAEEGRVWGWWVAPAGIGITLIALSVAVWRRRRAS